MKFKVGDRVSMYGAGDGSGTFWDGDKGKVHAINTGHKKDLVQVIPDEWPDELHSLLPQQLRRLKKSRLGRQTAWAVFDSDSLVSFFLQKKNAKAYRKRHGGDIVEFLEVPEKDGR